MRHLGCIHQRATHQNEIFVDKPIDKCDMFSPKWLLPRALGRIMVRPSR